MTTGPGVLAHETGAMPPKPNASLPSSHGVGGGSSGVRHAFGLCSVSFRRYPPGKVIELAAHAALTAIEWGADLHVPPDAPPSEAESVRALGVERGISVASYGSYFRASDVEGFLPVLETAQRLQAPRVRVWAGEQSSDMATTSQRRRIGAVLQECATAAAERGVQVGLEFHGGTLTDSVESTERLLDEVDNGNLRTYWQPPVGASDEEAIAGLERLGDRVCAVHAFSWRPDGTRMPLESRATLWRNVLELLETRTVVTDVLLEFVVDDAPKSLIADAAVLRALSRGVRP